MAGEPGCVTPLKDLRTYRVRHKQTTLGTTTRIWVSFESCSYQGLNLPGQGADQTGCRENGVRNRRTIPAVMKLPG